ncbi:hypothetical protein NITLEN_60120 [Nitrospira lenta]|uniref:Uncharacterized protein n=1 Tax=Nitrospira lenta TaxID=1436998 RepID=A0A330LBM3_9BACT|nr:hypothetical protein [Nitrospira lenta]SPP66317.1 hypothetical protein NITLEN_60120 [Nitrospira lenta]
MSMMEWMVIIGGIAAMIWINWYFFLARQTVSNAAINVEGVQEVAIVVEGGYHPAVVSVRGTGRSGSSLTDENGQVARKRSSFQILGSTSACPPSERPRSS